MSVTVVVAVVAADLGCCGLSRDNRALCTVFRGITNLGTRTLASANADCTSLTEVCVHFVDLTVAVVVFSVTAQLCSCLVIDRVANAGRIIARQPTFGAPTRLSRTCAHAALFGTCGTRDAVVHLTIAVIIETVTKL